MLNSSPPPHRSRANWSQRVYQRKTIAFLNSLWPFWSKLFLSRVSIRWRHQICRSSLGQICFGLKVCCCCSSWMAETEGDLLTYFLILGNGMASNIHNIWSYFRSSCQFIRYAAHQQLHIITSWSLRWYFCSLVAISHGIYRPKSLFDTLPQNNWTLDHTTDANWFVIIKVNLPMSGDRDQWKAPVEFAC